MYEKAAKATGVVLKFKHFKVLAQDHFGEESVRINARPF